MLVFCSISYVWFRGFGALRFLVAAIACQRRIYFPTFGFVLGGLSDLCFSTCWKIMEKYYYLENYLCILVSSYVAQIVCHLP